MDHEYHRILKTMQETELSMADNEKMLAEYKRKLPHQCKSSDYVLQQIKNDVESVKASIQQYDSKLAQMSSINFDPLSKRVAAIEQQIISSGTSQFSEAAMPCLRHEMSRVLHMQSKLMEEMKLPRYSGLSKIDELGQLSRYVDENKQLQTQLMKHMIAKDRLMADYIDALNSLKKEKEICLQSTKQNEILLKELKTLKDQQLKDIENKKKSKKLKQHVLKLKLELVEKVSLLQQENDKHYNMQLELTKAFQKLDKMKQKYSDVKSQLDESNRSRRESRNDIESNPQLTEWNMQLQVLLSTLDRLLLTSDNCTSHNNCSVLGSSTIRHTSDYGWMIHQISDKIIQIGHILTQALADKRHFQEQLWQAKHRNEILKEKLVEFKEDLLFH